MRLYDYARTPPEAPEGLVVFVVRFAEVVMAVTYAGEIYARQRPFGEILTRTRLNPLAG